MVLLPAQDLVSFELSINVLKSGFGNPTWTKELDAQYVNVNTLRI